MGIHVKTFEGARIFNITFTDNKNSCAYKTAS